MKCFDVHHCPALDMFGHQLTGIAPHWESQLTTYCLTLRQNFLLHSSLFSAVCWLDPHRSVLGSASSMGYFLKTAEPMFVILARGRKNHSITGYVDPQGTQRILIGPGHFLIRRGSASTGQKCVIC